MVKVCGSLLLKSGGNINIYLKNVKISYILAWAHIYSNVICSVISEKVSWFQAVTIKAARFSQSHAYEQPHFRGTFPRSRVFIPRGAALINDISTVAWAPLPYVAELVSSLVLATICQKATSHVLDTSLVLLGTSVRASHTLSKAASAYFWVFSCSDIHHAIVSVERNMATK